MKVIETPIAGCLLLQPNVFQDQRGFFVETYQMRRYADLGIDQSFVQDNHSQSGQGVLRGLHFQKTKPQGKLVRVVRGEVFDVAVDIRPSSPTLGCWYGAYLNESNKSQLWLAPGLAHGFVVLSETADLEYKCTDYYDMADEGCLQWNDADVGIDWPITDPILSAKDAKAKSLKDLLA